MTADKNEEQKRMLKELAASYREDPEILAELYQFSSRFYNYSPNNQKLIYIQNPHATFVGSYKFWNDQGYRVQPGKGSGMAIFVPVHTTYAEIPDPNAPGKMTMTKISKIKDKDILSDIKAGKIKTQKVLHFGKGHVFDISRTTCPKEDYPKYYHMGYDSQEHAQICKSFGEFLKKEMETDVQYTDVESIGLRGLNKVGQHHIIINEKLNDTERLSTLLHEGAHQLMHQDMENCDKTTYEIEFEADSLAIMLQSRYDIPIEQGRKRHIANHYNNIRTFYQKQDPGNLSQEDFINQKVDAAVDHAMHTFYVYQPIIDTYVESGLDPARHQPQPIPLRNNIKQKENDLER